MHCREIFKLFIQVKNSCTRSTTEKDSKNDKTFPLESKLRMVKAFASNAAQSNKRRQMKEGDTALAAFNIAQLAEHVHATSARSFVLTFVLL